MRQIMGYTFVIFLGGGILYDLRHALLRIWIRNLFILSFNKLQTVFSQSKNNA